MITSFSTCRVCGGLGTVLVQTPIAWCSHCQGTGKVKTFACPICSGKAVTPRSRVPLRIQACSGTGDDASAPAMSCLKCRGSGWVVQQGVSETVADSGKNRSKVIKGGEVIP